MFGFSKKLTTSLLASSLIVGGVTPVLAQYSCPSREIQRVHEVGDYKFELKGCQRSGKRVTCSAWVTQTNKDIQPYYYAGSTRLVDAAGTEYSSASIQVGNTIISGQGSWIRLSLVKDVPLQLSATFTDVPTSVQDVALFELKFDDNEKYRNLSGQLRNTQITESKGGNTPAIKKKK